MWQEIGKLLKSKRERFIIVEGGRPRYVVLRFDDYKNIIGVNNNNPDSDLSYIEKANKEIFKLNEKGNEGFDISEKYESDEDLRIEDLPF